MIPSDSNLPKVPARYYRSNPSSAIHCELDILVTRGDLDLATSWVRALRPNDRTATFGGNLDALTVEGFTHHRTQVVPDLSTIQGVGEDLLRIPSGETVRSLGDLDGDASSLVVVMQRLLIRATCGR